MADLQTYVEENKKERGRLAALLAGLKEEDFDRRLPNGWTVGVALAHLAFWDLSQVHRLKRWLAQGPKPAPISSLDPDPVNGPLAVLSESIPPREAARLAADAAREIDALVEGLTPAQAGELVKMGLERNLRRSVHRRSHLDKIEKLMGGGDRWP